MEMDSSMHPLQATRIVDQRRKSDSYIFPELQIGRQRRCVEVARGYWGAGRSPIKVEHHSGL